MEVVIVRNLLLTGPGRVGTASSVLRILVSMACYAINNDVMLMSRQCRILSQFRRGIDLFASHANFDVNQIRRDTLEYQLNTEPWGVGDVKEAGLVGNDVIFRHRSSQ